MAIQFHTVLCPEMQRKGMVIIMKKNIYYLSLVFSLALLIPALALPSFATGDGDEISPYSTRDYSYFCYVPDGTSGAFHQIDGLSKDDSTPVFMRIDTTEVENTMRVRAVGYADERYLCSSKECCLNCKNCTYFNGGLVSYVKCKKGINYSISTMVKEYNLPKVSLGFQSTHLDLSDEVSGWWSADTSRTHNPPIAP